MAGKTRLHSGKSEAYVTIIKDSARVIILLRLTTDGHKASRGRSATAELFVTGAICWISPRDRSVARV